jgi:hypothetical protein
MNRSQREYLQTAVNLLGTKEVKRRELETLSSSINIPVPLGILKTCPGSKKGYYNLHSVQQLLNPTTVSLDVLTTPTFEGIIETISGENSETCETTEEEITEEVQENEESDELEEEHVDPVKEKKDKQEAVEIFHKNKDEIDNPCYVVLNENQAIIWGSSYDLAKAYDIARNRCLHGVPQLTLSEVEKLVKKNNFARLWSPQCLNIVCTITKVQLET